MKRTALLIVLFLSFGLVAFTQEHESDQPDHIRDRESWFYKGRRAPDGSSGAPLLRKGFLQKQNKRAQLSARPRSAADPVVGTSWMPLGPSPLTSNATGSEDAYDYGFVSGRVTAVTIDQSDATGNTVYVGSANGGIWKSTNAASSSASSVTWQPLTDQQASLAIGSIALQPGNSNLIIAGTGEANFSGDSYYGQGILRSTDAGSTWTIITSGNGVGGSTSFLGVSMGTIAFSTDNPKLVVMGVGFDDKGDVDSIDSLLDSRFGIWYSTDSGGTWTQATLTDTENWSVNKIVYNPSQHAFYAAVGFHGVYRSTDGVKWTRLAAQPGTQLSATNCPATTTSNCPILRGAMAVRPGADEMYIWYVDNNLVDQGIYRTLDGGKTWSALSTATIDTCGDEDGCGTAQGSYNLVLSAVPTASGTDLYAGAINLYKCSLTASNTTCNTKPFLNLTHVYGCSPIGSTSHVHPDQHDIDFLQSAPNLMFFGNDGGMYRASNGAGLANGSCSGSNAFDNLNQGLGPLTQFVYFSGHPTDATVLVGGTQDNGSPATDSAHSGTSGTAWISVNGGDGGFNAISPRVPTEWFTSHSGIDIARCTSGIACNDETFTTIITNKQLGDDVSGFYPPFILDPGVGGVMLAGTCRLWRGPTTTATGWAAISPPESETSYCDSSTTRTVITAIAAGGPTTTKGSQVLWIGYDDGYVLQNPGIDSGAAWLEVYTGVYPVSSVVLDPTDPSGQSAYITSLGFNTYHVQKITPTASVFIDGDLPDVPVNSIAPDPENPNILYVGTDVGVFYTTDAGAHWTEAAAGTMPNAVVTHLQIFEYNKVKELRASTYGRGVWELDLVWNTPPTGKFETAASKGVSDSVSQGQPIVFTGWAADNEDGAPVSSVQLWLDGTAIGNATLGIARPDIAKEYNRTDWTNSGWTMTFKMPVDTTPGAHKVSATAYDSLGLPDSIGTLSITVLANQPPVGAVESAVNAVDGTTTVRQNGTILFKGWAADNEDGAPVAFVDADLSPISYGIAALLSYPRPDIATLYKRPDWLNSGWQASWDLSSDAIPPGAYKVFAFAWDSADAYSTLSGTSSITVTASPILLVQSTLAFGNQGLNDVPYPVQVSISNQGALAAHITGVTVTSPFTQTNDCKGVVAVDYGCTFTITFVPTAVGSYLGSVSIATDDGLAPHVVSLSGTAVADSVSISPKDLDFGNVRVGKSSSSGTVTITNVASHSVTLKSIWTPPYEVALTGGTCVFPEVLTVSGSCTIDVQLTPTQVGMNSYMPELSTDQPDSPRHIDLTANGTGGEITLNPATLGFPDTTIGKSSTASGTITNPGNAALHITAISSVAPYTITHDCGTLNPGASCTVTGTFTPTGPGLWGQSFSIASDTVDGTLGYYAYGTAIGSVLYISPTALVIPPVLATTPASTTVSVYNPSTVGVNIKSATTTAPFSVTNACTNPISARATCTMTIGFSDATPGSYTGTLNIITDDDLGSYKIPLQAVAGNYSITSSGSSSQSVTPGGTASYNVQLSATAGITATVTLSCNNLPSLVYCGFSPASPVSLSSGSNQTVSVTLRTTAPSAAKVALNYGSKFRWMTLSAILGMIFIPGRARRISLFVLAFVAVAVCISCGGGGGGSGGGGGGGNPGTPNGAYSVDIVATTGSFTTKTTVTLNVN